MKWNQSDDQFAMTFARVFVNVPRTAIRMGEKKAFNEPHYQREFEDLLKRANLSVEYSDVANRKNIKAFIAEVENINDPIHENEFFSKIVHYKDAMR